VTIVIYKNNYLVFVTYVTVNNICYFLCVYIKMKWKRCQQKNEIR